MLKNTDFQLHVSNMFVKVRKMNSLVGSKNKAQKVPLPNNI